MLTLKYLTGSGPILLCCGRSLNRANLILQLRELAQEKCPGVYPNRCRRQTRPAAAKPKTNRYRATGLEASLLRVSKTARSSDTSAHFSRRSSCLFLAEEYIECLFCVCSWRHGLVCCVLSWDLEAYHRKSCGPSP